MRIPRRHALAAPPHAAALISAARARGRAAARSGALDQWSFGENATLPYLDELMRTRDQEIEAAHGRASRARQANLEQSHRRAAAAAITHHDQQVQEERAGEALSFMRNARSEVTRLAWLEARQREERSLAVPSDVAGTSPGSRPWPAEPDPAVPDDPEGVPDDPDGAPNGQHDQADAPRANAGAPAGGGWAGPDAPRMTRRLSFLILLSMALVEIPIQYVIFEYFQQDSPLGPVFTWLFTLPVSAVMVLLPHLSGWWYRDRRAAGADRVMRIVPLLLLLPWAYVAGMLGYLRARVLLAPPPSYDTNATDNYLQGANGQTKIPSTAALVHVTPATMTVLFVALLLGVGGIGFMLGIARDHPLIGAYRGSREIRRRAQQRLRRLAEPTRLDAEREQALEEQRELGDEQREQQIRGIRSAYAAAAHAYLDAIAETMGDPMVTEAVTAMSQHRFEEEAEEDEDIAGVPV